MNFNLSIEFTGGIEVTVASQTPAEQVKQDLTEALTQKEYEGTVQVNEQINGSLTIVTSLWLTQDKQVKQASDYIQSVLLEKQIIQSEDDVLGLSLIGPSIGGNIKSTTIWILLMGLIAVSVYMMLSFSSISAFVSPTVLALVTMITMVFDLTFTAGAYGLYMMWDPTIQVNTIFVTAMLMIMGYSINDTIVIMDRIRENVKNSKEKIGKGMLYGKVFEASIWQTMRRSIGTSLSTFLVVIILFIFSYVYNATLIQHFAFVLSVGVLAGTYSSIFIAAPLVYILLGKFKKEHKKL